MHTIVKRPRSDKSDAFQVRIRAKGREPINETFDTEEQALAFVAGIEPKLRKSASELAAKVASARREVVGEAEFRNESLRDVLEKFAASEACTKRHRATLPTVIAQVGGVTIAQARPLWVKNYVARMLKTKTSTRHTLFCHDTLKVHLGLMNAACRHRAEELDLDEQRFNFSAKFFPRGCSKKRDRRLEEGEHAAIMAGMRAKRGPSKYHWRLLYRFAIETGARLQEILLSEWSQFKFDNHVWSIPWANTKTKEGRSVSMSKKARRILKLLKMIDSADSPRLFHTLGGSDSVSAGFHRLIKELGIVDLRFHDLRHEGISLMVLANKAGIGAIMSMAGHSSHEMTARYTNLLPIELIGLLD